MTPISAPVFRLDVVGQMPIVIKVEPHADPAKVQVVTWTLATAWDVQKDMERLAAEYEREADLSDRAGRTEDAKVVRSFASNTLTMATDLLVVLQGAEQKAAA